MKSTDGRQLKIYGDDVHRRQLPGKQSTWQESVVLAWWDETNFIGGFHRIGHVPNEKAGPKVALWNNITTPEGIYKNVQYQPLRKEDLLARGGFGGGDSTCQYEFYDGLHQWKFEDGAISGHLGINDVGPNIDSFPKGDAIQGDLGAAHFDIPGHVTGWLKVHDQEYKVNGWGVRDHAWGPRDTSGMLSHRWIVGTCGAAFSFVWISFHTLNAEDKFSSFGWCVRNNEVTYAAKLDIITYLEIDGATNRGGHVKATLTTGEVLDIECTAVPTKGFVCYHQNVACLDRICTFTCGDHKGFCMFETTTNMQHGIRRPKTYFNSIIDNGFYKTEVAKES